MVRLDEVRGGWASHLCVFARALVSVCQLCGCMYSTCARAHATHTQTQAQARTRTWPSAGVHDGSASHARAAAFNAMSPCPTNLRSTVYVVMKLCTCVCALVCVHACMRARARVHWSDVYMCARARALGSCACARARAHIRLRSRAHLQALHRRSAEVECLRAEESGGRVADERRRSLEHVASQRCHAPAVAVQRDHVRGPPRRRRNALRLCVCVCVCVCVCLCACVSVCRAARTGQPARPHARAVAQTRAKTPVCPRAHSRALTRPHAPVRREPAAARACLWRTPRRPRAPSLRAHPRAAPAAPPSTKHIARSCQPSARTRARAHIHTHEQRHMWTRVNTRTRAHTHAPSPRAACLRRWASARARPRAAAPRRTPRRTRRPRDQRVQG